jgi:hypothetical protein
MSSGFIRCRIVIWGITGMGEGGTAVCPEKNKINIPFSSGNRYIYPLPGSSGS